MKLFNVNVRNRNLILSFFAIRFLGTDFSKGSFSASIPSWFGILVHIYGKIVTQNGKSRFSPTIPENIIDKFETYTLWRRKKKHHSLLCLLPLAYLMPL